MLQSRVLHVHTESALLSLGSCVKAHVLNFVALARNCAIASAAPVPPTQDRTAPIGAARELPYATTSQFITIKAQALMFMSHFLSHVHQLQRVQIGSVCGGQRCDEFPSP